MGFYHLHFDTVFNLIGTTYSRKVCYTAPGLTQTAFPAALWIGNLTQTHFQHKPAPNQGMKLTAYNLRSCLASASSSGSYPVLGF